jgi:hypothetical protein
MSHTSPRLALLAFLVVVLAAGSGCSRISIAYNSADFLLEQYAKDYLSLNGTQIASWRPELERALARHRHEDLPYLARFFEDAHEDALKGFDAQRVRCLLDQLEDLYRRHMVVAVDLAVPLLAGLSPQQVRALEDKFKKEKAEDEADMAPSRIARRERKRAERYDESIAWWIGSLSDAQKRIVREETGAMPDTAADWIAYRSAERKGLIALLERGVSEKTIHGYLTAWLVEQRDLPARLDRAKKEIEDRIMELIVRLDRSFSPEQRSRFAEKLVGLRDDFMSLQRQPRMASVKCSAGG